MKNKSKIKEARVKLIYMFNVTTTVFTLLKTYYI